MVYLHNKGGESMGQVLRQEEYSEQIFYIVIAKGGLLRLKLIVGTNNGIIDIMSYWSKISTKRMYILA